MRKSFIFILLLLIFILSGCDTGNSNELKQKFNELMEYESLTVLIEVDLHDEDMVTIYGSNQFVEELHLTKDYNYIVSEDMYVKHISGRTYDAILEIDGEYILSPLVLKSFTYGKLLLTPELILESLYINYPSFYEFNKIGNTYVHDDITFYVNDEGMITQFTGNDPYGYFSYSVSFSDYNDTVVTVPEVSYNFLYADILLEEYDLDYISFDEDYRITDAKSRNIELSLSKYTEGLIIKSNGNVLKIGFFMNAGEVFEIYSYNNENFIDLNTLDEVDEFILDYYNNHDLENLFNYLKSYNAGNIEINLMQLLGMLRDGQTDYIFNQLSQD